MFFIVKLLKVFKHYKTLFKILFNYVSITVRFEDWRIDYTMVVAE